MIRTGELIGRANALNLEYFVNTCNDQTLSVTNEAADSTGGVFNVGSAGTIAGNGVCGMCHVTYEPYWRAPITTSIDCADCHGTTGKHVVHLALNYDCSDCHDTSSMPLFSDGQDLANTTVCSVCHQDGRNGEPASDDFKIGWDDALYDLDCTGCHGENMSTGSHAKHITPYQNATIIQLTDNDYNDYYVETNNSGMVVWRGFDGNDHEIFLYDGVSIIQLTDNSYDDRFPQINESGTVVWAGSDGNDDEIYLYDGNSTIQLTDNTGNDREPQINDNGMVVWYGVDSFDYEIYLYDGNTITQLTDNSISERNPQLNNRGEVVWDSGDNYNQEIYLYDGTEILQLADSTYSDTNPQINDNGDVVWKRYDVTRYPAGYYHQQMFYDSETGMTTQLTDSPDYLGYPQINDSGTIVWYGRGDTFPYTELYFSDGVSVNRITDNTIHDMFPEINEAGTIVWTRDDGVNSEISLMTPPYDENSLLQLTDNSFSDAAPKISDTGIIVWQQNDGSDLEIFLMKPQVNATVCADCHDGTVAGTTAPEQHLDHNVDVYDAASGDLGYPEDKALASPSAACANIYCHSDGTTVTTGTSVQSTSPIWGSGSISCSGCHGYPPDYNNGAPKANSHQAHSGYSCEYCHSATTITGNTITDPAKHGNQVYNVMPGNGVSFDYTYHVTGGTCATVSCHGDADAQWGQAGSVSCLTCHATALGSRSAITDQFSAQSHHVQGTAVSGEHCYQCHWEANSDGTVNTAYHNGPVQPGSAVDLVIYGNQSRPAVYTVGSSAVQYTADGSRGEIAKLNDHCLGCHGPQNDDISPFINDDGTPTAYAWDGLSIGARYSQATGTTWGKYTSGYYNTAPKNLQKAFSAHGNAAGNQSGFDPASGVDGTLTDTTGTVDVLCFDCHNSHGSNVTGKTTSYNSATTAADNDGGLLKDTVMAGSGYTVAYQPVVGGSVEDRNSRNPGASLCLDCHLTASGGTSLPWGYQTTFGASAQITGYFDTPDFGPGTFGPQIRYPYKASIGHQGGHFGASGDGLTTSPQHQINGLCTPCHDPHGVSPNPAKIIDQNYGVPLLKGTWLTSPYKEDAAPSITNERRGGLGGANIGSPAGYHIDQNTFVNWDFSSASGVNENVSKFGGLCLTCHSQTDIDPDDPIENATWGTMDRVHDAVNGWGGAKHKYSCSKCHIPHNSRLPRLMVTNCLNFSHRGQVATGGFPGKRSGAYGEDDVCGWGDGSGGGQFPGGGGGYAEGDEDGTVWEDYYAYQFGDTGNRFIACHDDNVNSPEWPNSQLWNTVTPWDAIGITGPSAGSFTATGSDLQATISWTTQGVSSSYVDYGPTTAYGSTTGSSSMVISHAVVLHNLTNHSSYHYQVRSANATGEETSPDFTFNISVPPPVPTLTVSDQSCASACAVTLQWNAVTDPDGGPIRYLVEVDTSSAFNTANKQSAVWIPETSWSPTLSTATIWYARLRSRDNNHTTVVSAWSSVKSFNITIPGAPPPPTLSWPPDGYSDQVGYPLGTNLLQWNTSSGATEYYCEWWGGSSGNSGWTTATSFDPGDLADNFTYYWHVKARNGTGESLWSATWSWYDYWPGDSCPFIFTWNGTEYEYETDLQGPVIGLPAATPAAHSVGLFQPANVVLNNLVPENGMYRIKMRETLAEISYLDLVKLLVVDYPAGYELVSSTAENTYSYGYVNPETIYTIHNPRAPTSAFATNGDDILASVTEVDNVFAPLDYTVPEYITLNFGAITDPANAKLVIDGWTVYSADLRTSDPVQPHVEVLDAVGNWTTVRSFGEPAGDLKRMVVPLGDVFQNSDHRIRLHLGKKSGGRWRLDRVLLDESVPVPIVVDELRVRSADLYHAGMVPHNGNSLESRIFATDGSVPDQPEAYGYGSFTRYGDVKLLLRGADDRFVIMRHGDAVDLEFLENDPPEPGMTRGYLLKIDMYYKSFRVENNVEPLPFHGMSVYPPAEGESYPDDPEHLQYLQEYNTRTY